MLRKRPSKPLCVLRDKTSGTAADFGEIARIIRKALQHGKNRRNLIAVGIAQGKCTTLDQGGSWEGLQKAAEDDTVHIRSEKIWAVKSTASCFTSIAFASDAKPGTQ